MEKKSSKTKLKQLLVGKQSLRDRFPTAFWPALLLSFILFFFGPLDLSRTGESYLNFTALEVLPTCLLTFLAFFTGLFLISWLPGGKLHASICSLICGLGIAFYVQGNFLNINLGSLDGTAIEWHRYSDNALINLGMFSLIMLIPFPIHFFSRKVWKAFLRFVPIVLLAMQIVPLVMMLVQDHLDHPAEQEHFVLKKDREYELGKENIVVFFLDYVGPDAMSAALEKYPDMLDPFHDFHSFDNYHTFHFGTFPSLTTLLTHQPYDREIPYEEWFDKSWHSDDAVNFYTGLKEDGWDTRIFNLVRRCAGTYENEYGLISNVQKVQGDVPFTINRSVFRKLIKLSFYRYFPLIMKAPFWIYTDDLNEMKNLPEDEQAWTPQKSVEKYLSNGLSLGDKEKVLVMYHYLGAHTPYTMKINGQESDEGTSLEEQVYGHFYIVSQYIQQMKDLHVYDSSTIIITADHGSRTYPHAILYIKPAGQRQNAITVSHAPVTQMDFMATIAEAAGIDKGPFGRSVYDVPEDEVIERCTGVRDIKWDMPIIEGKNSNIYREYCYTGGSDELHRKIADKEFELFYMPYPYY